MVTFRSRIGDDGSSALYEGYVQLFPDIEDQSRITVQSEYASTDPTPIGLGDFTKDDLSLKFLLDGSPTLELSNAVFTLTNAADTYVWNIFDNPEHIRILQDPKEKYEDVDKYSAEPPVFSEYPLCHGILVEFSALPLPATFSLEVIAADSSVFLNETGTIEL